jgi:hypothetical protein
MRHELSQITADGTLLQTHAPAIARLSERHPHSISVVEDDNAGAHGYNCFMYALGVRQLPPPLVRVAQQVEEAFPGSAFVVELLEGGRLREVEEAAAHAGCVVIYFENGLPEHAGIVQQHGFVVSKWGKGHLYRHRLFEVPSIYGDNVRFFEAPQPTEVLRRFADYVERITGHRIV